MRFDKSNIHLISEYLRINIGKFILVYLISKDIYIDRTGVIIVIKTYTLYNLLMATSFLGEYKLRKNVQPVEYEIKREGETKMLSDGSLRNRLVYEI